MKKIILLLMLCFLAIPVSAKSNFSYTPAENNYQNPPVQIAYSPINVSNPVVINGYASKEGDIAIPNVTLAEPQVVNVSLGQFGIDESKIVDYVPNKRYESSVEKKSDNSEMLLRLATGLALGLLGCAVDPYTVTIDGIQYMFILDNYDTIWNVNDIFGMNDTKDNVFYSLKKLNKDGSVITGKDLQTSGIRLVAVNSSGRLELQNRAKDFNLEKVSYIDVKSFKKSLKNNGKTGQFGTFDMYIYNFSDTKVLVKGEVTFETIETLNRLFGDVVLKTSALSLQVH